MHHETATMISTIDYGIWANVFVVAMSCNFCLHIWRFAKDGETHNLTHALHHAVMGVTMGVLTGSIVFWAVWFVIALEVLLAAHIWLATYRRAR